MDKLLYLLGPLGCAAMMGAMMWMMRGQHRQGTASGQAGQPDPGTQQEIAALRAEIAELRGQGSEAGKSDSSM